MWPFRKREDPPEDAGLRETERQLVLLEDRAHRVEKHLRARFERNHWSETVNELWQGRDPA